MAKGRPKARTRTDRIAADEAGPASDEAKTGEVPGPVPNTNLILADIALRGGDLLLRRGIERGLLGARGGTDQAGKAIKGRSKAEALVGGAIAKLATRSVPGAILVGGGLLAKTLFDRRKARAAKIAGESGKSGKS